MRLLGRAKDEGDWELCKELARFLQALDESGNTLREALQMVDLRSPGVEYEYQSFMFEGSKLKVPRPPKKALSAEGEGSSVGSGSARDESEGDSFEKSVES